MENQVSKEEFYDWKEVKNQLQEKFLVMLITPKLRLFELFSNTVWLPASLCLFFPLFLAKTLGIFDTQDFPNSWWDQPGDPRPHAGSLIRAE